MFSYSAENQKGLTLNLSEGLARLLHPAVLLVIIGAVLGFGGEWICGKVFPKSGKAGLIARLVGVALVMVGLILLVR